MASLMEPQTEQDDGVRCRMRNEVGHFFFPAFQGEFVDFLLFYGAVAKS